MKHINFDHIWSKNPGDLAIFYGSLRLTYSELRSAVIKTLADLKQAGIEQGERIALFSKPSLNYILYLLTAMHLGAITVPLSRRYSESQIADILNRLNIQKIITDQQEQRMNVPQGIQKLNFMEVDIAASDKQLPLIPFDRAVTILLTSGSSGTPKAVLHTMGNHYYSAKGAQENIPIVPGDRWLLSLPLYHVGGLAIIFRTLLAGGTLIIPEEGKTLAGLIAANTVSHISLVPTQLKQLLDKHADLATLKAVLLGGAVIPPDLIISAKKLNIPVCCSYGSTEMASQIATTPVGASNTAGTVLQYRQIKISSAGEILVKGTPLSPGYIDGDQLLSITDNDGWFHSGDLGKLDQDGNLHITGRRDTMFISGGENIFPEEIEAQLLSHVNVQDAIVVDVADEKYGARPVAFIRSQAGKELSESELRKFLQKRIEKFKIPDFFRPWPAGEEYFKNQRMQFKQLAQNYLDT